MVACAFNTSTWKAITDRSLVARQLELLTIIIIIVCNWLDYLEFYSELFENLPRNLTLKIT